MSRVLDGFVKAAGFGSLLSSAAGKMKSFFSGTSTSGPMTIKLKRPPAIRPGSWQDAVHGKPSMKLTRGGTGGSSIPTTPHVPTPTQARNTQIRSEMKRGLRESPTP